MLIEVGTRSREDEDAPPVVGSQTATARPAILRKPPPPLLPPPGLALSLPAAGGRVRQVRHLLPRPQEGVLQEVPLRPPPRGVPARTSHFRRGGFPALSPPAGFPPMNRAHKTANNRKQRIKPSHSRVRLDGGITPIKPPCTAGWFDPFFVVSCPVRAAQPLPSPRLSPRKVEWERGMCGKL